MTLYQNQTTGEIRDLDDALIAAWQAAGNPKVAQWVPYIAPPEPPPEPPAPIPDWLGFAGWLYGFSPMMDAMNAARASHDPQGEPATTGLPAALQEARAGNTVVFALSWAQFLAASSMQPSDLAEIIAKATTCRLPPEFIAALQPVT